MNPDQPTLVSTAIFLTKVQLLRARRWLKDLRNPLPKLARVSPAANRTIASESRTPLWTANPTPELAYEIGKVQNLRAAAALLNGIEIPAGRVFSFWRQLGRATRRRGFVPGRMLQQGCLVPSVGGGLCQLSNALYQSAVEAGCEIVERHAHSRVVPGSAAALGNDATIAWNYVDLRFRAKTALQLEVRLTATDLIVRFLGTKLSALPVLQPAAAPRLEANNCFTCGADECLHHPRAAALDRIRTQAFLMDERWPEFETYVAQAAASNDAVFIPLNGLRYNLDRYTWILPSGVRIRQAPVAALRRSWNSRRLAAQGAARQRALLDGAEQLARAYAKQLEPEMTNLVVAQSLLPFLWRDGHLGGREFSVVMTRLPIANLEQHLDREFARHPDLATLADFRAPAWLRAAEAGALAAAHEIITPHTAIAALFPGRAHLLNWTLPLLLVERDHDAPPAIAFPGPAVARRGAHLVRDLAREHNLRIVTTGRSLEGTDFWQGLADPAEPGQQYLGRVQAVVLPAILEHQPRALLAAIAAGVPVIASSACGIPAQAGVTIADTPEALEAAMQQLHYTPV